MGLLFLDGGGDGMNTLLLPRVLSLTLRSVLGRDGKRASNARGRGLDRAIMGNTMRHS